MSSRISKPVFRRSVPRSDRQEALRAALEARGIVRDLRRRISTESSWIVAQTDWEDTLFAERENWREALWAMNRRV